MAIVKMKKFSLIGVQKEKDEILHELLLLGCVEISEPPPDAESEQEPKRLSTGADAARLDYQSLTRALDILSKRASVKTSFFNPLPDTAVDSFFRESDYEKYLRLAGEIEEWDSRIKRTESEEARELTALEALTPWVKLDLPLDFQGTKTSGMLLGSVPLTTDLGTLERDMSESVPECRVFKVSESSDAHHICVIYLRERENEVGDILRGHAFAASAPKNIRGTAAEASAQTKARLTAVKNEREELRHRIQEAASSVSELRLAHDVALTRLEQENSVALMTATDATFAFTGWITAENEVDLIKKLSGFDCAWEFTDPEPEEYPEVPVVLKNNALTAPLSMVTEMYSLPAYDGIDPNPIMAPFFVLFYGLMMADMAYGVIMVLAAVLVKRKKRPSGTTKQFLDLLLMCGVSTFVCGILTGGIFADAPTQIAALFGKSFTLPYKPLIDPLNNTVEILIGSLALGFIHIIAGMAVNFYMSWRDKNYVDAVLDNVPWWLAFAGIALGALGITWYVAIGAAVLLVATQGRSKPTVAGKIISGLGSLYNISSYFSDVLSYSRVMALMLAGGVIAQVFNTIAALTGNIIPFMFIFLIGHSLNIGLNLLGCYVHDLRLQCLEYFGKFYKDGGRAFNPLRLRSKYFNIVGK